MIEQDHRRVKQRLRPMLGLKSFGTAAVVIGGVELADKIGSPQEFVEVPDLRTF
jgi:transposase-like protein